MPELGIRETLHGEAREVPVSREQVRAMEYQRLRLPSIPIIIQPAINRMIPCPASRYHGGCGKSQPKIKGIGAQPHKGDQSDQGNQGRESAAQRIMQSAMEQKLP